MTMWLGKKFVKNSSNVSIKMPLRLDCRCAFFAVSESEWPAGTNQM
jgi:hypothetical protein